MSYSMSTREALSSTSPDSWTYTSEGGANLVLSYAGPSSTSFTGRALRLRKRKKLSHDHDLPAGEVDLRFANEVIAPLIWRELVVEMEKVEVGSEWLNGVKESVVRRKMRPVEREEEDEIDEMAGYAVLMDDLVSGEDGLVIEIKPKWGFLPSPLHLGESRTIKEKHCRFCMHTLVKHYDKEPEVAAKRHQDGYCPLDLYSGDRGRVEKAVSALWDSWASSKGERNNLRFFVDGEKVSPNDPVAHTKLVQSIYRSEEPYLPPDWVLRSKLVPILLSSPVLARLKHLQSSLDPLDIEGLTSLLSSSPPIIDIHKQPSIKDWISWTERRRFDQPPTTTDDLILAYLLSATFKDCSIFIRIEAGYRTTVKVIDLDPKPIERLRKYFEMDKDIVEGFSKFLKESNGQIRECKV